MQRVPNRYIGTISNSSVAGRRGGINSHHGVPGCHAGKVQLSSLANGDLPSSLKIFFGAGLF